MYKLQNEKQTNNTTNDGTILKYHRKLIDTDEKLIPITHIHMVNHFCTVLCSLKYSIIIESPINKREREREIWYPVNPDIFLFLGTS